MKYAPDHKQNVTEKLKVHAANQIRQNGAEGVSVKSVMAAEGMTVGGFYAHFDSKESLLIAAVRTAFVDVQKNFYDLMEDDFDISWLQAVINDYLSTDHRDNPAEGCPAGALLGDMPRQSETVRTAFEEELKGLVERYMVKLAGLSEKDCHKLAVGVIAILTGGLQLARSMASTEYSDEVLKSCIFSAQRLIETAGAEEA